MQGVGHSGSFINVLLLQNGGEEVKFKKSLILKDFDYLKWADRIGTNKLFESYLEKILMNIFLSE